MSKVDINKLNQLEGPSVKFNVWSIGVSIKLTGMSNVDSKKLNQLEVPSIGRNYI